MGPTQTLLVLNSIAIYLTDGAWFSLVFTQLVLYTVKKGFRLSCPQPGCHSTRPGIIKIFPARENLVSDIPQGMGKSITFFHSVLRGTHLRRLNGAHVDTTSVIFSRI
jgi:hypothetical protein